MYAAVYAQLNVCMNQKYYDFSFRVVKLREPFGS